ncbi:hypothetical protein, partial [Roseisolibacter sp. H3M3-2]|uniref:diacylglycerol/lipid kinase family protein n=1 Tax=Roseisolibacter sp. H3M3-2 TaxID=3031323 RepID=UPI0023DB16B7
AARRAADGRPRDVDVVQAGDAIFCTVGGLGIVSRAAFLANALRARPGVVRSAARAAGPSIYRLTAAAALLSHGGETRTLTLSWLTPAGVRRDETLAVHGLFVTNQRWCGGGLAIPGGAVDDDGVMELCLVPATTRPRLLDAFTRLSLGLAVPPSVLRIVPAREAHLVVSDPDGLLGDGEELASGRVFSLRVRQRALRVVV